MALILIALTAMEIRSAYLIMITLFFYGCSTLIFLLMWLVLPRFVNSNKRSIWLTLLLVGQVLPLLYYSSLAQTAFATFIPFAARNGVAGNEDFLISILGVAFALLMGGFIVRIFCKFLQNMLIFSVLDPTSELVSPSNFGFLFIFCSDLADNHN